MTKTDFGGAVSIEKEVHGFKTTTVNVVTEDAAKALGKVIGAYISIDAGQRFDSITMVYEIGECVAEVIQSALQPHFGKRLCICGLGNPDKVFDCLGPEVTSRLPLAVLNGGFMKLESRFDQVCACDPRVLGLNGVTTDIIVEGIAKATGSDCLLLVDSLIAKDYGRLLTQIQISTAGGASAFQSDKKANWPRLGIPVVSIGVPTAMPLSVLIPGCKEDDLFSSINAPAAITAAARIIAYAILRVCWPSLSAEECYLLTPTESTSLFGGSPEGVRENIC